jgi:hypothetical protein
VSNRPDAHQTKASSVRTTWIPVRSSFSKSFELLQLASVRMIQQPVWTILNIRSSLKISFQNTDIEDCCIRPDDVDSSPDALIHKTSISIQIQTFGRQSAWFGRASIRYGNCVHHISRLDNHPLGPDARSLYMEITCSEHATIRTTGHHRLDAALKQVRFSVKFSEFRSHSCPDGHPMTTVRTAPSFIKPDSHLNYQPINRGP